MALFPLVLPGPHEAARADGVGGKAVDTGPGVGTRRAVLWPCERNWTQETLE